jgi:opine dehydrogenase
VFRQAFPSAVRVTDGLDAALTNWGPVLHPPLVVQNLGAIESLGDRFDIHNEGTSAGVIRTILALDDERVSLRVALGFPGEHWPISTHYEQSPEGMYGADARQRLVASGLWRESLHLEHRYVREDILCGLTLNASLGRLAGCPMPVSEAVLALVAVSVGVDPWTEGRTATSIGAHVLDAVRRQARHGVDATRVDATR